MSSELRERILFTLFILIVYRVGTFIPLPGIDSGIVGDFFSRSTNSILGMINTFSGGAFQRMSIFSLNIMPYITASIIIQLLTSMYKSLEDLRKEGELGRKKLNQYTKYLTLALGCFQSIGIYYGFSNLENSAFISTSKIFLFTTVFTLLGSTMFLMWLGDRITSQGIGNGISLITTTSIVAELPANLLKILQIARSTRYFVGLSIFLFLIFLIIFIVYMEKAMRNVKIQYPNRSLARIKNDDSYMPLKINISGVIPPIFASSLLMFPLGILQFFRPTLAMKLSAYVQKGGLLYSLIFTVTVVFFSFFYSEIVFNTEELAENLKKGNCFIPGIRPGKNTADYFNVIVGRLTAIGSAYLVLVCIVPDVIFRRQAVAISLGGTSLLIVINTVIELITQFQAFVFSERYSSVSKKRKMLVK
ncbi:MAG: preprotein translocase subunit SecY [Rickettsiales bacterium]|jgi:preprotein translocase subunit SecY|nr:preprotein translocase subunit SecY [Rickettsiales bacterium]